MNGVMKIQKREDEEQIKKNERERQRTKSNRERERESERRRRNKQNNANTLNFLHFPKNKFKILLMIITTIFVVVTNG